MDEQAARRTLGVAAAAPWVEVRAAYRTAIRAAHPDVDGGSTARAASLNAAYATLLRRHRAGGRDRPSGPPSAPAEPAPAAGPVEVLDGDTLHLALPPDEAFARLVEAGHRVGSVTYLDRSCPILEVLVEVPGEGACSLVITLQGRSHGTDAFCTLEAIEHVGAPPVTPVVRAMAAALAHWDHG